MKIIGIWSFCEFTGTVWVTDIGPTFEYINEYGSRFPSTDPILGIYLGPGSQVRVQVPKYGSRSRSWPNIGVTYGMSHWYWANFLTWTSNREPGPVLGNLDPYSGTWTRTWEPRPVLGNLDLNRSQVWNPYSGTLNLTVLLYVLKVGPILMGHTVQCGP